MAIAASFLNRIIHGDCIKVMQAMPNECVDLVVTDPPFLVNYRSRDGRGFANNDQTQWLEPAFAQIYRLLKPDRMCVSFYGWPKAEQFLSVWKGIGLTPVSHLVWIKRYASTVGFTRGCHATAYLLAKGEPAKPASPPRDVFDWGRYTENALHPTQTPVHALTPLILAYSVLGDVILDPFAGSGTTGIAARNCHRSFILIEQVWRYYKIAQDRLARNAKE